MRNVVVATVVMGVMAAGISAFGQDMTVVVRPGDKVIQTIRGAGYKGFVVVHRDGGIEEHVPEWSPGIGDQIDRYHAITDYYRAQAEYFRSRAIQISPPPVPMGPGFKTIPGTWITDGFH